MEGAHNEVCARLAFDGDEVYNLKVGSYLVGNVSSKEKNHDIGVNDPSVDVKHAAIDVAEDSIRVIDLFSQHGTYIDGKRLKRFEVKELSKHVKIQFGSVIAYFAANREGDSGFLGLNDSTGKDTSIIPNTPTKLNECTLARSRDKNPSETATSRVVVDQHTPVNNLENEDDDDEEIFVKGTQLPSEQPFRNNTSAAKSLATSLMEEDDDYFIPATQEQTVRDQHCSQVNDSCDMFQLNTQDFHADNECSNDSDDLLGHISYVDSMIIPPIEPPKLDIFLPVNSADTTRKVQTASPELRLPNNAADGDDNDTDCEEELLALGLDKLKRTSEPVEEHSKSGSVTPDLNIAEQDDDNDLFEPTQAFVRPITNDVNITLNPHHAEPLVDKSTNNELSIDSLDHTERFVIPAAVVRNRTEDISFGALEQTQVFQPQVQKEFHSFSVPSIAQFDKTRRPAKKVANPEDSIDESIEPTQVFVKPPAKNSPKKGDCTADDSNELEATQKFVMPIAVPTCSRETSRSPVLLDSDEEDADAQFCLAETLIVDDNPKAVCSNNSDKSPLKKNRINRLFGSDDEEENACNEKTPPSSSKSPSIWDDAIVQPTPDFAFFKLPSLSKLDEADAIFYEKSKRMARCKTILEASSDEDEENDPVNVIKRLLGESEEPPENSSFTSLETNYPPIANKDRKEKVSTRSSDSKLAKAETRSSESHAGSSKQSKKPSDSVHLAKDQRKEKTKEASKKSKRKQPENDESNQKTSDAVKSSKNEKRGNYKSTKDVEWLPKKGYVEQEPTSSARSEKKDSDRKETRRKREKNAVTSINGSMGDNQENHIKKSSNSGAEKGKRETRRNKNKVVSSEEAKNDGKKREKDEKKPRKRDNQRNNVETEKSRVDSLEMINEKKLIGKKSDDFQIPNENLSKEIHKCKVVIHKNKIIDPIPESDDRAVKKRNHADKDESAVPRKRNKENDPSNIQPVIVDDGIISLRKSSRSAKPRILFTKMDSKPHEDAIEKIGGTIVCDPADCTVLITHKLTPTWKMFSAIGKGIPIVTEEWLHDALVNKYQKDGKLPNCDDYMIKDKKSEIHFDFNLKVSLEKARKSKVFTGYTFHCTPNIKPTPKEMQSIVECSGGKFINKISRDFVKPAKFYVISDKNDKNYWPVVRKLLGNVSIVDTNAILKGVMQQPVDFETYLLFLGRNYLFNSSC